MKTKISFIIFWAILVVSFLFFATVLILEANGLRINFKTFSIEQTGLIILNGEPKNITLNFNKIEKKINLPIRLPKLLPGTYDVSLTKDGYQAWNKVFKIEGGKAKIAEDIYLFFEKPKIKASTENGMIDKIKKAFSTPDENLLIKDNEIWVDDELVTRFSQSVKSAVLTREGWHVVFQSGKEIRVIELDGSNNTKLIDLTTEETVPFMVRANKIYYIENNTAYEAQVR